MTDINNAEQIKAYINNILTNSKLDLRGAIKDVGVTNYINGIAKNFGYNKLTMDDNELYHDVANFLRSKLNEAKNNSMKNKLNETSDIITNVNMLNYQDNDVIKIIKAKFNDEFKNYRLEKIVTNEEGPFYTMEVTGTVDSAIKSDLELKRFHLVQLMNNFKGEFLQSISSVLPVVNTKIASYQMTKNSDKIKFAVILLLSNTNNRNWVTGAIEPIDEEEKDDILKESKLNELRVKSNLVPISLMQAINQYKSSQINRRMLETAIKACKRNELEKYVMDTLNLKIENPTPDEDDKDDKEDLDESIDNQPISEEQMADQLFQKYKYDFDWHSESVKEMRNSKLDKSFIIGVLNILAGVEYFDDKSWFQ